MHYPGDFRGEYTNPALFGEEALGVLHVIAQPYQANDPRDRLRVLLSGFIEGLPGYVAQGSMTVDEAINLAQSAETAHAANSPEAKNRRQVSVHLTDANGDEVAGIAVYDSSIALGEVVPPGGPSGKLARMTAYAVASCTTRAELFNPEQLRTIGAALGYGALLDARAYGFERIRYQFPGLAVDLGDERQQRGIPLNVEMDEWLASHPWLRR